MRCNLASRQMAPLLAASALLVGGTRAGAAGLSVSSATVAQPGDTTRVCVSLVTGGQEIAGTQNDLVWDGTCLTLNDGSCFPAGSHGKQVNTRIQNSADFRMRVLVLSLTDVDPIDDGVLYCCTVQAEAEPGACCSISVGNTGASDSQGNAVSGVGGNTGRVCVQRSGNGGGGAVGGVTGGQLGASNAPADGGGAPAAVPDGAAGGGTAPAPPPVQVLQGGGGGVQVPTAAAGVAEPPPTVAAAATPAAVAVAATVAAPAAGGVAPPPAEPTAAASVAVAPPTAAPTAPPTAPPTAAADTATPSVPTAVPTTRSASAPTAARPTPAAGRGWFGCQVDSRASGAPPLALALLLAAATAARRFRRARQ